jgi:hypothetical protein
LKRSGKKKMVSSIVTAIKSSVKDGLKRLLVEVFKGDPQWHNIYTLPGIETAPVKDEKCLLIPLDKSGKSAVFGVTLKTDIADGEVKINGRNSAGQVRGFVYLKDDGSIHMGLNNFVPVVTEGFKPGYDTHSHTVVVGTATLQTSPPTVGMLDTALSSKVKVES